MSFAKTQLMHLRTSTIPSFLLSLFSLSKLTNDNKNHSQPTKFSSKTTKPPQMSYNLRAPCPKNSILYNQTLCSCSPGYLYNTNAKSCSFFTLSPDQWVKSSIVKYSYVVEDYQKLLKFQLFYITALVVALLVWLLLCALVRLRDLGDGRSIWFWIRWQISRLDVTFSTRHWLPDQTPVRKQKTELGGTFSIASWILFIGLFVALTYQNVSRKGTEVYGMKATNVPDLLSFTNDLQLNVTTISTMTCSQLRGLDTVALGTPGFIDYRLVPLSTFANFSCTNSTTGPKITLKIKNCPLSYNHAYISWHFVDAQNAFPASAIGFQFNFTASNRIHDQEYANFVSGTVKNEKGLEDMRVTYRGKHTNLLKFNLFPRVYLNLDNLELVQPLFHEFRPGSYAQDERHLQSLLQSSEHGFVNITVALNFLSDFLVEIDEQKYGGAVGFLADVGGLYCLSVAIFLLLLFLCESRVKRLQNEDQVMQRIRKRRMAVDRWHKLRKYVAYTYGCRLLNEDYNAKNEDCACCNCMGGNPCGRRIVVQDESHLQTISLSRQASLASRKVLRDSSRSTKGDETNNFALRQL